MHREAFDFLNDGLVDFAVSFLLCFVLGELDVQNALLYQVIIVERVLHFAAPCFVRLPQILILSALHSSLVEHVWVEEAANVFVVSLQRLQDQQRRDDEEDLSLSGF